LRPGLTVLEPFEPSERLAFWAVAIATGVISVALVAAVIALLEMAAENSSPADLERSGGSTNRQKQRARTFYSLFYFKLKE
jgi:hypothetical protein